MIPKRMQMNALFNNGKTADNFSQLGILKKYQIRNNNATNSQISFPNESFLKPKSPILLKRSSLIKYDDCIPFADGSDDLSHKTKMTIDDKIEKVEKPSMCTLFKTGSISSLKISSLKEQWPSSEYVQSGRCKVRTQSTCNEHRYPLPSTVYNGSVSDHSTSMAIRPMVSVSSHSDLNTCIPTDKAALASCLSKCDNKNKSAATELMKRMDFTDMSLVESLQNFIKKIPVIGESQERDRILTYFTDRFMECNPVAFKNNDACHTLVCALMLLNTDIHGQVSKKRMTCKEFVDNILTNYPENNYKESDLISVYGFIRKTELKNEDCADGTSTLRRKFSQLINKSLKPPAQPPNNISIDPNLLNQQHFISGNIMRKCIKRPFGKKPALGHRGWKLQFASLIGLQLLLFKTNLNKSEGRSEQDDYNGDRLSLTDSNISSELLQNDNSSLCLSTSNTKSINSKLPSSCSRENIQVSVDDVESCIKIHHALASVVEKLRHKNVFSLRLADEAEYFFKVKRDQLDIWVNNINYAAAILSAPPIVGAGQCGLYKPLLPGYTSDLDKKKQILSHEVQIRHYQESLKKLQLVNSKARAINESNIQFCKYEIARFEAYVKLLCASTTYEVCVDESVVEADMNSVISVLDASQSAVAATGTESPCPHIPFPSTAPNHDMTTLRRRPPRPPVITTRIHPISANQSSRPVVYSPLLQTHHNQNLGARPSPSFSRFIEPQPLPSPPTPDVISPLPQHHCMVSDNKLPQYSPPSARHNINQVS